MTVRLIPTKTQLDAILPQLEAYARDWVERECTSFDAAVLSEVPKESEDGSIWDVPAIDSKRVVALLAELEELIGGNCKLPVSAIESGGYENAEDLIARLLPKLREKCPESHKPGIASVSPSPTQLALRAPAPQVLR